MNQDKGLTIIEVIASVAVLAVIVLVIVAILQNSSSSSASSNVTDRALQNARTVMEEIKNRLDTTETTFTYLGQTINLTNLRNKTVASYEQTIYYPSDANRQYGILIRSRNPGKTIDPIPGSSGAFNLNDVFREVTIVVTDLQTSRTPVTLQSMVAY